MFYDVCVHLTFQYHSARVQRTFSMIPLTINGFFRMCWPMPVLNMIPAREVKVKASRINRLKTICPPCCITMFCPSGNLQGWKLKQTLMCQILHFLESTHSYYHIIKSALYVNWCQNMSLMLLGSWLLKKFKVIFSAQKLHRKNIKKCQEISKHYTTFTNFCRLPTAAARQLMSSIYLCHSFSLKLLINTREFNCAYARKQEFVMVSHVFLFTFGVVHLEQLEVESSKFQLPILTLTGTKHQCYTAAAADLFQWGEDIFCGYVRSV